jgi:hypothetical protein
LPLTGTLSRYTGRFVGPRDHARPERHQPSGTKVQAMAAILIAKFDGDVQELTAAYDRAP